MRLRDLSHARVYSYDTTLMNIKGLCQPIFSQRVEEFVDFSEEFLK